MIYNYVFLAKGVWYSKEKYYTVRYVLITYSLSDSSVCYHNGEIKGRTVEEGASNGEEGRSSDDGKE